MNPTAVKTHHPTSDRIQDALYGFARSQLLFSAIDLDLFSAIATGDDTLEKLCSRLNLDARAGQIFLDGLVGIGFLEKSGSRYVLPEDVKKYLTTDSPNYMGGMVSHCKRLYENWAHLTGVVHSGLPAGGAQSLADVEVFFSELVKGLYVSNYPTAQSVADLLEIGGRLKNLHILDVAGGSGVWSIAMLEKDPQSKATLLDYPMVTQVAQEYVDQHHLADRYDLWPTDLEVTDFPHAKFDLAVLGNICHAIGAYSTQKLLTKLCHTLVPGGRVVIIDFVPDDARSKPGWPLLFGVNMLISTPDGNVFTEAEYRDWLKSAGFSKVERFDLESEITVIVGEK